MSTGHTRGYLVKQCVSVCLKGYFWMRLKSELVDWVKEAALASVGGLHSICRWPEENKKLVRKNSLSLPCWLWVGASVFCFQTQAQNYPIGFTGSGLLSFRNPVNQFLKINLFIHIHTHTHRNTLMHTYISCCSCFSVEPWWPHQQTRKHSCDWACLLAHTFPWQPARPSPRPRTANSRLHLPTPDTWVQSSLEESHSCAQPKLQSHRPMTYIKTLFFQNHSLAIY